MHEMVPLLRSMVDKLSCYASLDDADVSAVLALPATERRLERGNYVMREGDKSTHCYLLLEGFAIRHKVARDGGRQIVNIHLANDLLDLENVLLAPANHSVQALTAVKLAVIPRAALMSLASERPAIAKALWFHSLVEGSVSREWIMNVGRRKAPVRIAHLLCEMAYRLGADGQETECHYELPMTQEQIADATGLTPVHVNRSLRTLDQLDLIERTRRSVFIVNLSELAEYGGFNSRYLHLPQPPKSQVPTSSGLSCR